MSAFLPVKPRIWQHFAQTPQGAILAFAKPVKAGQVYLAARATSMAQAAPKQKPELPSTPTPTLCSWPGPHRARRFSGGRRCRAGNYLGWGGLSYRAVAPLMVAWGQQGVCRTWESSKLRPRSRWLFRLRDATTLIPTPNVGWPAQPRGQLWRVPLAAARLPAPWWVAPQAISATNSTCRAASSAKAAQSGFSPSGQSAPVAFLHAFNSNTGRGPARPASPGRGA